MKHCEIHLKTIQDLFYYDGDSRTGLRWKVERTSGVGYKRVMARAGDTAGSKNPSTSHGYWVVTINKSPCLVHILVYELHYGKIKDSLCIDYIDGCRTNNRIENLRLVTKKTNSRNRKIADNNTSGFTGVSFINRKNSPYYAASWTGKDGKVKTKTFSTNKTSDGAAFEAAKLYRTEKLKEINLVGKDMYTDRHIVGEVSN